MNLPLKNLDKVNFFSNNFDFLRFFAATLVIAGHSYALLGTYTDPLAVISKGAIALGPLGLFIFFIISGFLITKSWLDSPNLVQYFKKRILRIFPGLAVAVLFSILVIGPIVTSLGLRDYFSNSQTWDYLRNIIMQTRLDLPGAFADLPVKAVNGSLWTLPVEFWMYIFIAMLGISRLLARKSSIVLFIIVLIIYFQWHIFSQARFTNLVFINIAASEFARLGVYFFIGSAIYLYKRYFVINNTLALLMLALSVASFGTAYSGLIMLISLSYLTIYVAYSPLFNRLRHFGKYGDFSYGMYIYAFPIQQTIVHFFLSP